MTLYTAAGLFLSILATGVSLFVWIAWRRSSIRALQLQLSDLSASQEALNLQLRSVKVRISALSKPRKDGKFARSDDDEPSEAHPDPAEWKRRTNLQLALGKFAK